LFILVDIGGFDSSSPEGLTTGGVHDFSAGYDNDFFVNNYFDYEQGSSEPIVKGRLKASFSFWKGIGANPDVLDVISLGYKLPFTQPPPSTRSRTINPLIPIVPIESDNPFCVVNPLSVAVQSSGKLRLILDLRYINKYLYNAKIKFEDWKDALKYITEGDFMFSFDLKSGYHHIDIFPDHTKYLGFAWQVEGVLKYFSFTVLPFGLSNAPYIFTKCLRPLVRHWLNKGMYIVVYLDDGWAREVSSERCGEVSSKVKSDLLAVGFVPNIEKSVWSPTQELDWLGMTWNAKEGFLKVTDRRVTDIISVISKLLEEFPRVTARKFASITGKIVSLYPVVGNIAQLKSRWDSVFFLASDSRAVDELHFWKLELTNLNKRFVSVYSIPQV
jgi:hypothetical protein